MSEEFTITDISKKLGGFGLMVNPNAAEFIIKSDLDTNIIIDAVSDSIDSGSTIDIDTIKNIVNDIDDTPDTDKNTNDDIDKEDVGNDSDKDDSNNISDEELNSLLDDNTDMSGQEELDETFKSDTIEFSNEEDEEDEEDESDNNNKDDLKDDLDEEPERSTRQEEFANEKDQEMGEFINSEFMNPEQSLYQLENVIEDTEEETTIVNRKETLDERFPEWCDTMFNRKLPDIKPRVGVTKGYDVEGDITGESRGTGDFEDFRQIFKDRHDRLTKLLGKRAGNVHTVSDINKRTHGGKNITVVGLVWSKFVSNNGNYFIELEDPKSNETLRTVFTDEDMKDVFEQVVPDEVIAIRGTLSDDGGIVFGDNEFRKGRPPIMFPDIPRKRSSDGPDKTTKAALISDIHVGADEFFPTYWNKFVDWVRETPTIEYVIVAGDLVEGIGVFPEQDEELTIVDIYDQYAMTGKMFDQLPDDVQIITSVGNHDTVRLAEPQPTLAEEFTKYFSDNVDFVGNPVNVNIDGANILIYHGMSINALAEVVPGADADEPTEVMKLMLQKRHVAPVYGKNVRLAGEEKDYLIIDTVPDLLHCGHVHKYGQDKYNGVNLVNTATWQGQTSFQKSKGIEPDVGYWATVDLSTMDVEKYTVDDF